MQQYAEKDKCLKLSEGLWIRILDGENIEKSKIFLAKKYC